MNRLKSKLPSTVLFFIGVTCCGIGLFAPNAPADQPQDFKTLKSLVPEKAIEPERAIVEGYFVSHDQAASRGGVGSYVTRPSGEERKRVDLYRVVSGIASFTREEDGRLNVTIDNEKLFHGNAPNLDQRATSNLDQLAKLVNSESARLSFISGSETQDTALGDERIVEVETYLSPKIKPQSSVASFGI